jgi:hypothetical protein
MEAKSELRVHVALVMNEMTSYKVSFYKALEIFKSFKIKKTLFSASNTEHPMK